MTDPRRHHRLRRVLGTAARGPLMRALARRESRLLAASDPTAAQPVFVIGPPRSGTTLLHELLVTRFRFAYFAHAAQALWKTPAAATSMTRGLIQRWTGDYTSDLGQLRGPGAPHEAARIWARWLPGDSWVDPDAVRRTVADECARTVAAVTSILPGPFLSKNPTHSARIAALHAVFPRAIFLELRRDAVETAHSILAMRRAWHGSDRMGTWLAVRPRDLPVADAQHADPVHQVCAQVAWTRRTIRDDCARLAPDRHIVVGYDDLCRDPRGRLEAIAASLERRGVVLNERGPVPARFDRSAPACGPSSTLAIRNALEAIDASIPGRRAA